MARDASLREWLSSLLDARSAWRSLSPAVFVELLSHAATVWSLMPAAKAQGAVAALVDRVSADVVSGGHHDVGTDGSASCDTESACTDVVYNHEGTDVRVRGPAAVAARVIAVGASAVRRGSSDIALPLGVGLPVAVCGAMARSVLRAWSALGVDPSAALVARVFASLCASCSDPALAAVVAVVLDPQEAARGAFGAITFVAALVARQRCPDASLRAFSVWVCAPMESLTEILDDDGVSSGAHAVIAGLPALARAVRHTNKATLLRFVVIGVLDCALARPPSAWYAVHVVATLLAAAHAPSLALRGRVADSRRVLSSVRCLPGAISASPWLQASRSTLDAVLSKLCLAVTALALAPAPLDPGFREAVLQCVTCTLADALGAPSRDGDPAVLAQATAALYMCACRALE